MSRRFATVSNNKPILFLVASLLLAGALSGAAAAEELLSRSPERGGIGLDLQRLQFDSTFNKSGRPPRGGLLNKLDERLSIIVTDKASTSAITFTEVMERLAADMHVDKLILFQRWWDTANEKIPRGKSDCAINRFCNCETDVLAGLSRRNGFPYQCPRVEGKQSKLDPFKNEADGYTAIAFVNRFDLADKQSGANCGEFRIVFARNSGFKDELDRNLIIFEALVPNPDPKTGVDKDGPFAKLAGCRPIVEFWLNLSNPEMSTAARGKALHDFFLKGLPKDSIAEGLPKDDIGRIVDASHYAGGPCSGQIRTNQFMQGNWTLREFKTDGDSIVPATVKSNPGNDLFSSFASEDPRKREIEDYLVTEDALNNIRGIGSQTDAAGERSVFTFAFGLTTAELDHLNSFDSMAQKPDHGDIVKAFEDCGGSTRCPLGERITAELDTASPLNADIILNRIRTQTCAGCHHYSNNDKGLEVVCPDGWPDKFCSGEGPARRGIWPDTLGAEGGFTHISENEPGESGVNKEVIDLSKKMSEVNLDELRKIRSERISHLSYTGPDGCDSRYKISNTLKLVLMPPRFENMVLYLNNFDPP
jgi:hypothetical protein